MFRSCSLASEASEKFEASESFWRACAISWGLWVVEGLGGPWLVGL